MGVNDGADTPLPPRDVSLAVASRRHIASRALPAALRLLGHCLRQHGIVRALRRD